MDIEQKFYVITSYPFFLMIFPLLLIFVLLFFGKKSPLKNLIQLRDLFVVIIPFVLTLLSFELLNSLNFGYIFSYSLVKLISNSGISFKIDNASAIFFFVISFLWFSTSIYSVGYLNSLRIKNKLRFYSFFALSIFATIGVCFSQNLLTLFVFYEILSLSTYPLVTHNQNEEARFSGRKYIGYLLGGSVGLVLPAMLYVYLRTGTLDFVNGGILFNNNFSNVESFVLLCMFVFGFAKCAIMPMHAWLPNAMVAPTPVSALLHAVAVVKVGIFSIFRVVYFIFGAGFLKTQSIFGVKIHIIFCILAGITILLGSLLALNQDNFKKRLAYSTISQLSYILLGIFLLNKLALVGALFYLVCHAFAKITLFYTAGVVQITTSKKYLSQMQGIGYKLKLLFFLFALSSLSLIGLPPLGGFVGKVALLQGAFGNNITFVFVYLISSFLACAYLVPILLCVFKKESKLYEGNEIVVSQAPRACMLACILTTIISLFLFFYAKFFIDFLFEFVNELIF